MTKTKRIIAFILLITILASLIFIGKVANIEAKKNSNTKKKITMTVGQKKTIKLNKNVKIKWKTSNKKVVSVSKKGVIKAKKVGKAKVTAKLPNKKVQYTVKVNKKPDNKTPEPTKRPPMTYAADVIIDHIEKIDDEYSYVYGVPNEEKTGAFGVAKIGSNGIDMLKIITKNSQIDRLKASAGDYVIYICSYGVEKKTEGNILLVFGNGYGLAYNKGPIPTAEPTSNPSPTSTPRVVGDTWLLFSVDQQTISTATKNITGALSYGKYESVVKILVNDKFVTQKEFTNNEGVFSIEVDLSQYKTGDKLTIRREYIGENKPNFAVWNETKQYILYTVTETPAPTIGPDHTPEPEIVADAWLLFGVDQETLTVDTKKITGILDFNMYESAIKVYVNNNLIAQKDFVNGQQDFTINVDFSNYTPGDSIVISRQYIGEYIPNTGVWNEQKTYTLCTSSGIVPTPTPLPPNYDWYYEGEPHEKGVILLTLNKPTDAKTVCAMLNDAEIEDIEDIYKTFYDRFKDDDSANSDAVEIIKNNIGTQYTITLVDKSDDFLYKTIVSLNANPLVKYAGVNHIVGPAVIW